jgi:class 3 adenylate cyclase
VRRAIDVRASLRTRHLANPASRQMSFRIGITTGDVVERDGDLLGEGARKAGTPQVRLAPETTTLAESVCAI